MSFIAVSLPNSEGRLPLSWLLLMYLPEESRRHTTRVKPPTSSSHRGGTHSAVAYHYVSHSNAIIWIAMCAGICKQTNDL